MEFPFQIRYLDHVAIRVKDLQKSAQWYEQVLGMKPHTFKEWGDFPIFMLLDQIGIALFPASTQTIPKPYKGVKIDHFAFNVDLDNFEKAQIHFKNLDLSYNIQDHHFFKSIYIQDIDGHTVELTTLVLPNAVFR